MNSWKQKTWFNRSILALILGIIGLVLPISLVAISIVLRPFSTTDSARLYLFLVTITEICSISGLILGINEVRWLQRKKLAILAVVLCCIGIVFWMIMLQSWMLMGGLTDLDVH
jgi:hypothetical protein